MLAATLTLLALTGCASRGSAASRVAEEARQAPVLTAPPVMHVTVAIQGRVSIPARSVVRVQLRAASDTALVVGEATVPATGGRPYRLRIPIEPTLMDPSLSYAVVATIARPDGRVVYRTPRQTAFLAGFIPDGVELTVAAPPRS